MSFSKETINKINKHSLEQYPDECCGVITGNKDAQTVHECINIQNSLHAEDPATHSRDAGTAYAIERKELDGIIAGAKSRHEEIIAFYHSHIEHDAYFSETDEAAQTVFGEPEFPDAVHIIVSVRDRKIKAVKCYKWNRDKKGFTPADDCV